MRALREDDASALAATYDRNRVHLARWDPVRSEDFFTGAGQLASARAKLAAIGASQVDTWLLHHVGEDGSGVVGQININNIIRGVLQSASIGYFVDHEHLGRGLATRMVEHAVRRAGEIGLHRLEAGTIVDNVAQRILNEDPAGEAVP